MQAQASSLDGPGHRGPCSLSSPTREGEPVAGKPGAGTLAVEEGRRKAVACVSMPRARAASPDHAVAPSRRPARVVPDQSLKQYKDGERSDLVDGPADRAARRRELEELAALLRGAAVLARHRALGAAEERASILAPDRNAPLTICAPAREGGLSPRRRPRSPRSRSSSSFCCAGTASTTSRVSAAADELLDRHLVESLALRPLLRGDADRGRRHGRGPARRAARDRRSASGLHADREPRQARAFPAARRRRARARQRGGRP